MRPTATAIAPAGRMRPREQLRDATARGALGRREGLVSGHVGERVEDVGRAHYTAAPIRAACYDSRGDRRDKPRDDDARLRHSSPRRCDAGADRGQRHHARVPEEHRADPRRRRRGFALHHPVRPREGVREQRGRQGSRHRLPRSRRVRRRDEPRRRAAIRVGRHDRADDLRDRQPRAVPRIPALASRFRDAPDREADPPRPRRDREREEPRALGRLRPARAAAEHAGAARRRRAGSCPRS